MSILKKMSPVVRALLVVGGVMSLATGATFAALSDSTTLTDNNIISDTADLSISNGGTFGDTAAGFAAMNITPGIGQTFNFYMKNSSTFGMIVTARVPDICSLIVTPGNDNIGDCKDVLVTFDDETPGDNQITYTLQQLMDGPQLLPNSGLLPGEVQGSPTVAGTKGNYTIKLDLDPAGVIGTSARLNAPFDIIFNGVQVTAPTPTPLVP